MSRFFAALLLALGGCRSGCAKEKPTALELSLEARAVVAGGRVRAIAAARDGERPLLAPEPAWSIEGPATIERGFVTATGEGELRVTATLDRLTATATLAAIAAEPDVVRVDPSAPLQTMTGWEVTAQIGQLECDRAEYDAARTQIYDRAIDELGIDRVRLEFRANVEHSVDYTKQLLDGTIDFGNWAQHRYVSENDDGDPAHAKEGAFQLTEIDHTMEHVVKPLAERLAKRGERLYLSACFVAFDAEFHRDHPEEYAELVLVVFEHLRAKHRMVPDALEVILEPDVAGWGPGDVIKAIRAVGPRLEAAGFHPAIIAPSNTDMGAALDFFSAIQAEPDARRWLTDFSYHRYRGAYAQNLEIAGAIPARFGVRTMMLEKIDASDEVLHADLEVGLDSAWQRFGLAFCLPSDDGSAHYLIQPDGLHLSGHSRFFPQYFRRVRIGAVRHFASASSPHLHPLAFQRDGKWTVIVRSEKAGPIRIEGLPEGSYAAEVTTPTEFLQPLTVSSRREIDLPAAGVVTIFEP